MEYIQTYFIENQTELRMFSFIILIFMFLGLESIWPKRPANENSKYRRLNNIMLLSVNFIAARFAVNSAGALMIHLRC